MLILGWVILISSWVVFYVVDYYSPKKGLIAFSVLSCVNTFFLVFFIPLRDPNPIIDFYVGLTVISDVIAVLAIAMFPKKQKLA